MVHSKVVLRVSRMAGFELCFGSLNPAILPTYYYLSSLTVDKFILPHVSICDIVTIHLQLHLVLLLQDGAVVIFLCGGRVWEVKPLHNSQHSLFMETAPVLTLMQTQL